MGHGCGMGRLWISCILIKGCEEGFRFFSDPVVLLERGSV